MPAPMLTPGSGGGSKPKPKPEPQKPTVPLVVYTAFDADTAETLKERLEQTIHPVDQPSPARKKATHDPPPYEHESSKGPKAAPANRKTRIASEPVIPDLPQDIPWSSETPFPSLDAGEMSDYFSAQEDNLVRDVSISLQREKFILHYLDEPLEYLKHFATYTWDEESDAAAEKFIQWYVKRFRTELERQRESDWSLDALSDIEYWIREVANDERESVIVYDLETGDILLVRYGDRDSVTMQDWHQRLAEGRNIMVIHNHPNNSGASWADLNAATWLDAEYMMIVNRDGTVHRHQKIDGEIVELEPLHNPDIIAPVDPLETVVDSIAYWIQTLREIGNPAEMVFEQGDSNEDEITIDTDSRLVSEFLLDPAAIVFLDDVAKEYGVEDLSLFSAMVPTIIYRELQDRLGLGLPNADNPAYHSNWDALKALQGIIWNFFNLGPIWRFDRDPSLGVGAISRLALFRIQRDARESGIDIYAPLLGFDMPTTLSEVPFSEGVHERTAKSAQTSHFANWEFNPRYYPTIVIPPSNENSGAWRIKLAGFTETEQDALFSGSVGGSIQQLYEPTLGIIAAEVAIAMQTPEYQELQTEEERIAFLIAYHASRSAIPAEKDYNPANFRSDTHREIRWAGDFMELMDEIRTEIQSDP